MSVDTPLLRRAVPALRVELADAATRGRTVTLAEASAFLALPHPRSDDVLEDRVSAPEVLVALRLVCAERGEPDLAALVLPHDDLGAVHATSAEERRRCWRHWGGPSAEAAGLARTGATG